jgi:SnoaL-like domain
MTTVDATPEACEQARALIGRYVDAVDRGRAADVALLFTDDGVLEIRGVSFDAGSYHGRAAIEARFTASAEAFAARASADRVRHHVSSTRLHAEGADAILAASYFLAVTDRGVDHWGRYQDRIVRGGGDWRFGSRLVVHEGRHAGSFIEELAG